MEETSTNIHMGLVRRNNFLRENPISGQIVAARPEPTALELAPASVAARASAMTEQEPERSVSACELHW